MNEGQFDMKLDEQIPNLGELEGRLYVWPRGNVTPLYDCRFVCSFLAKGTSIHSAK